MATLAERTPTHYPHIFLDERGRGWIDDTRVKVVVVVLDHIGPDRLSAEQIRAGRPNLSLAQIHAALTYYFDHQASVDAEIAQMDEEYARLRAATENPKAQARLRAYKTSFQGDA